MIKFFNFASSSIFLEKSEPSILLKPFKIISCPDKPVPQPISKISLFLSCKFLLKASAHLWGVKYLLSKSSSSYDKNHESYKTFVWLSVLYLYTWFKYFFEFVIIKYLN